MNTPDIKTVRNVLIGFTIAVAIAWLGAEVRATEVATDSADRSAKSPLADFSSAGFAVTGFAAADFAAPEISSAGLMGAEMSAADVPGTQWARKAERAGPPSLLNADEAQSSDKATGAEDRGESNADPLGASSLAAWLPAAANLSYGDAALVDTFVLAFAAIHSTDAAYWVCDTLWELQDLEGSKNGLDTRPLDVNLARARQLCGGRGGLRAGQRRGARPGRRLFGVRVPAIAVGAGLPPAPVT